MRLVLIFAYTLTLATFAYAHPKIISSSSNESAETYIANMEIGTLTIRQGKEEIVIPDIVGHSGQTTRTLLSFNGRHALKYENSGSNTYFEVFYTITPRERRPFIDCLYGNIRNGQNGISIRKAVCNLQHPLTKNYQDLIFTYSDAWIETSNLASIQSINAEPSKPAVTPLGQLGGVEVALRYDSVDDLISASPKTIAIAGQKSRELTAGNAYLVYDADGTTPVALDVETDPAEHLLKRLTPSELTLSVEANCPYLRDQIKR